MINRVNEVVMVNPLMQPNGWPSLQKIAWKRGVIEAKVSQFYMVRIEGKIYQLLPRVLDRVSEVVNGNKVRCRGKSGSSYCCAEERV